MFKTACPPWAPPSVLYLCIGNPEALLLLPRKIKKTLFESLGWKVLIFEDRYYTPLTALNELVGNDGTAPSPDRYERPAPLLS